MKLWKLWQPVKDLEKSNLPEKQDYIESLGTGLSDLLYMVFVLAEHYGIELEEVFLQRVSDYVLRLIK